MLVSPCHKTGLYKRYFAISGVYYYCNRCDLGYHIKELANISIEELV